MKKVVLLLFLLFIPKITQPITTKNTAIAAGCTAAGIAYGAYATKLAIQYWAGENYTSPFYEFLKTIIPVRARQALIISSLLYTGYSIADYGYKNYSTNSLI